MVYIGGVKIKPVQNKRVSRLPKAKDGQTPPPEDAWEQELPGDIEMVLPEPRPKRCRKKKPAELVMRLGGVAKAPEVRRPKDDDKTE